MIPILIVITLILCYLRIIGYKSQAYQAMAHLFTGAMIIIYVGTLYWVYLVLLIVLSIVEIAVFTKDHKRNS